MKKLTFLFLSFSMILSMMTFPSAVFGQTTTLYLSDLEWTSQSCGASSDFPSGTQKNAAVDGSDMVLVKDGSAYTFTKGLGAHAPSRITYDISSLNATHFSAYVGVDACTTNDYNNGREGIIANFIVKID